MYSVIPGPCIAARVISRTPCVAYASHAYKWNVSAPTTSDAPNRSSAREEGVPSIFHREHTSRDFYHAIRRDGVSPRSEALFRACEIAPIEIYVKMQNLFVLACCRDTLRIVSRSRVCVRVCAHIVTCSSRPITRGRQFYLRKMRAHPRHASSICTPLSVSRAAEESSVRAEAAARLRPGQMFPSRG